MPKRASYDVLLVNLVQDHEYYWGPKLRSDVADLLTGWFKSVVAESKDFKGANVRCWWSYNSALLEDDELVIHFLADPKYSIIRKLIGSTPDVGEGGLTTSTEKGMVSEVYLSKQAGDPKLAQLVAVVAFHELMHNKLDADPALPKSSTFLVHKMGGAGQAVMTSGCTPIPLNFKRMGHNLAIPIKQYTGHLGTNSSKKPIDK